MTPTLDPEPRTDASLALVQVPASIPAATMAIAVAVAQNAALTATALFALRDTAAAEQRDR